MSHNTKWTQEEVQTLTSLRKKKVQFNHIAMVLGRSPMACQQKAWSLANPEYIKLKNKRKHITPTPSASQYIELYKRWEESAKEWKARCEESERSVKELEAELKHAQECMQAIQLNMNQFYNYS
jgi:hypothetical protein